MTDRGYPAPTPESGNSLSESRVERLSRLLRYQALLFVAVATAAGIMWSTYRSQFLCLNPCTAMLLKLLFWIGLDLAFLTTCRFYREMRQVAGADENIKRTAQFRVAVPFTVISLIFILLYVPLIVLLEQEPKVAN